MMFSGMQNVRTALLRLLFNSQSCFSLKLHSDGSNAYFMTESTCFFHLVAVIKIGSTIILQSVAVFLVLALFCPTFKTLKSVHEHAL